MAKSRDWIRHTELEGKTKPCREVLRKANSLVRISYNKFALAFVTRASYDRKEIM